MLVRTVYVDWRTHYRIGKAEDGTPHNVMLRRMADDGQSYFPPFQMPKEWCIGFERLSAQSEYAK